MARDYARIMTSIWKNKEFRALEEADQRDYLMLVTQPDISAAGVLRLSLDWWAQMAVDSRPEVLAKRLAKLEAGRFIILDLVAGEVLIRSFIRWDAGFNNPKRRPVIIRAAEDVRSDRILATLAAEFIRVGLPELEVHSDPDALSDRASHSPSVVPPEDDGPGGGEHPADLFSQVDRLSGREPGSEPGTRMDSTSVSSYIPGTQNPTSRRPPRDAADDASEDDDLFEEFWVIYPRKIKKVDARKAWRTVLRRKVPADRIVKAALRQADRWREQDKDIEFIPHPSTWLRGGSYDDDPDVVSPIRRLKAVAGGHVADPANGIHWEQ